MKKHLVLFFLSVLAVSSWAQYRNPVIPGYHPDPSICRVGDDFYIVNSSFQYFPGVPIYHSKDLVNWELIGNVLDRASQLPLQGASSWLGIYAPTIRYHEGVYYMITTNVGKRGNFMVTATDPRGPWSEPIWLRQGGIDPSLYFEDGKCYMVSNPDVGIWLCEIDPKTGEQLTESKLLWRGTGGRHPEGPHIYKKDGYYYLLISEGGTELAHKLTIARSKNIYGPYEANPANPILTHCSMAGQGSQIQGTGHGDFVQAGDGSWWLVFLGYRNFGGSYHHLGRETYLAPVEWKSGEWPVVNGGNPVDTLMNINPLGVAQRSQKRSITTTFDKPLGAEWVYIQNPDLSRYALANGKLQLTCSPTTLTQNETPTFVGRRQESENMLVETRVALQGATEGAEAGLTVYQIHDGHADLCLRERDGKTEVAVKCRMKSVEAVLGSAQISGNAATLRVRSDGDKYFFDCSEDGKTFTTIADIDCPLLSTEVVGGFTGMIIGMYATENGASGKPATAPKAQFDYFKYEEK